MNTDPPPAALRAAAAGPLSATLGHMKTPAPVAAPSAWLPMAMSLASLAVVLTHIAYFGTAREADQGTAAHIWQLLMAAQVPIVVYFALRWVPRSPDRGFVVLALQLWAALAEAAPVFVGALSVP